MFFYYMVVLPNLFYNVPRTLYGFQSWDSVVEVCQEQLLQWKEKALHGKFLKKVSSTGELSLNFWWLMYSRLKLPTEAQVVVAQDKALAVRVVQNHIYGISVPF